MLTEKAVLDHLEQEGAVLTGSHFVFTDHDHGTAYVNVRAAAHQASWLKQVGHSMAGIIRYNGADVILGPETLGRTLAQYAALETQSQVGIWCDIVKDEDGKRASFSEKLNFGRLVEGKRVAIVDDLLTTGSSIKLCVDLVVANGGTPVMAVVIVRRTPDVDAEKCGVPELRFLADIPGFVKFTKEECTDHGPCSQRVPMVLRPGHGHEWIEDHPDYPVAS